MDNPSLSFLITNCGNYNGAHLTMSRDSEGHLSCCPKDSFPTVLSQAISPGEGQGVTHSLLPSGLSPAYKLATHWAGCPDHRWEIPHCLCAKDAHGGGKRSWYAGAKNLLIQHTED